MMTANEPELSLVVACYQEEEHLEGSFRVLLDTLRLFGFSWEIIFVEDKSRDRTREIVERILAAHPELPLRAVYHDVNQGRGRTVSDGMRLARGRVTGFIDIDLEVHPLYMALCVDRILKGECDVVLGRRSYNFSLLKIHRYLMTRGYQILVNRLLRLDGEDTETGYKFFDREKVLPLLDLCRDPGWFWDTEIVLAARDAGLRIGQVDCLFIRREEKTSTVNPVRDSWVHLCRLWNVWRKRSVKPAG